MKAEAWQVVEAGDALGVLSADNAKVHLRIDGLEEDALIEAYVRAAVERCAGYLGRALATQTIEAHFAGFPSGDCALELPLPPVQSIESVTYRLEDGSAVSLASTEYRLIAATEPAQVAPATGGQWPTDALDSHLPVVVRFTAGYTTMPEALVQAVRWDVGHMYENREAVVLASVSPQVLPQAVERSLDLVGRFRYVW